MHQCIKFILFWNDTLHVSDGLSVHHQDFKTVFILEWHSTCFERSFRPSTGVQECFYFGMTFYMFRTVFPSIIRTSRLFLFWNDTLHVSNGLSVHHQEFKSVFILEWHSTCFGRSFRPSSGVQDCFYFGMTFYMFRTVFPSIIGVQDCFYFGMTFYMFRTVFPSIIRSSRLFLFWNDILHISNGLSVHHQEFKTVHTATGICQTDTAVCLLADSSICLIAVRTVLNSWWWTERPSETCRVSFQNKINLTHLLI